MTLLKHTIWQLIMAEMSPPLNCDVLKLLHCKNYFVLLSNIATFVMSILAVCMTYIHMYRPTTAIPGRCPDDD